MRAYTVESGDTLLRIAQQHEVTLKALEQANPQITDANRLRIGQTVNIPDYDANTHPSEITALSAASPPPSPGGVAITADQLCGIVPGLSQTKAAELMVSLIEAMQEFSINTPARETAFLAQIAHETGGFQWLCELGSDAHFACYEGRRDLGNTQPGDGPRYKGRGFIQITGRANYQQAGEALGLDLINKPQLAETPSVGARIAGWFWHSHGLNIYADQANDAAFQIITKRINGGLNGLADRQAYYQRARAILGIV